MNVAKIVDKCFHKHLESRWLDVVVGLSQNRNPFGVQSQHYENQ